MSPFNSQLLIKYLMHKKPFYLCYAKCMWEEEHLFVESNWKQLVYPGRLFVKICAVRSDRKLWELLYCNQIYRHKEENRRYQEQDSFSLLLLSFNQSQFSVLGMHEAVSCRMCSVLNMCLDATTASVHRPHKQILLLLQISNYSSITFTNLLKPHQHGQWSSPLLQCQDHFLKGYNLL